MSKAQHGIANRKAGLGLEAFGPDASSILLSTSSKTSGVTTRFVT
jgi:hypothetical protein